MRDSRGYHCCVCPISDNYDLCAACVDEHYGEVPPAAAAPSQGRLEIEGVPQAQQKSASTGNRALTRGNKEMGQAIVKILKKKIGKNGEPVPTSDPEESAPAPMTFAVPSTAEGVPMHKG